MGLRTRAIAHSFSTGLSPLLRRTTSPSNWLLIPLIRAKYNPVERCWGTLEQRWNADLLDTIETVVQFVQTMRRNGNSPVVHLLTTLYQTGVRLTKKAMAQVETHVQRLTG